MRNRKHSIEASKGTLFRVGAATEPPRRIRQMAHEGILVQVARGVYRDAGSPLESHEDLALVGVRKPGAVICLLSALRFHELTTESPGSVWIAVEAHSRAPKIDTLALRVCYLSGPAFSQGIEVHQIVGVPVRIYGVAKTIADCFKFRNQIGTRLAVEALREAWRKKKVTVEDLYRYARVCRVRNVMRPYLEGG